MHPVLPLIFTRNADWYSEPETILKLNKVPNHHRMHGKPSRLPNIGTLDASITP